MASYGYTTGVKEILDRTIDFVGDSTIKLMLLSNATSYTYDPDHLVADTGGANDPVDAETNVSGYVRGWGGAGRKALASKTMTVDNTNNWVKIDAADPSAWTLASGQTVVAAIILKEGAANDTTSRLIFYVDFTDTATNGGTFTVTFNADGIATVNM
jgi:hypothetical protein